MADAYGDPIVEPGSGALSSAVPDTSAPDPRAIQRAIGVQGALSSAAKEGRGTAQGNVRDSDASTIRAIEEAAAAMKASRAERWNMPLMMFGAGMMKSTPGKAGNFFGELAQGVENMQPAVHQQRANEEAAYESDQKINQIKGLLGSRVDLEDVKYQERALLQAEKEAAAARLAGAKVAKPTINPVDGSMTFFDPASGKWKIRTRDGAVSDADARPDPAGVPQVPAVDPASPPDFDYLRATIHPDIDPDKMVNPHRWQALEKVARTDPQRAQDIWGVLNYKVDPNSLVPQRGMMKPDYIKQINAEARAIDPRYEPGGFTKYNTLDKEWLGKNADKITSAQTAMNHVGDMIELVEAMKNKDSQLMNKIGNKWTTWSGNPEVTNYKAVAKLAGDELAKYIGGTGQVAEGSKEEIAKIFSDIQSERQLKGAIKHVVSLLNGRLVPMADQKEKALGNRRKITAQDLLGGSADIYKRAMALDTESFPTPTAAHIEALKAKPNLGAVFDEKFGPGASKKALGQ